jgi:hypothetical protein
VHNGDTRGAARRCRFFQRHRKLSAPARERHDQGSLPQNVVCERDVQTSPLDVLPLGHLLQGGLFLLKKIEDFGYEPGPPVRSR